LLLLATWPTGSVLCYIWRMLGFDPGPARAAAAAAAAVVVVMMVVAARALTLLRILGLNHVAARLDPPEKSAGWSAPSRGCTGLPGIAFSMVAISVLSVAP
jgi:hypothetical protein